MSYINSYKPTTSLTRDQVLSSLLQPYDLNSIVPVPPILANEHVALVPFIPAIHAEIFCQTFLAHKELQMYFPGGIGNTFEEFLSFVEIRRRDADKVLFVVIDRTKTSARALIQPPGEIAGIIGWTAAEPIQLSLELGPVITLPKFQGTHVSANAIGLLLKHILDLPEQGGLGYLRAAWCALPKNMQSMGIAEKMGFKEEGRRLWATEMKIKAASNAEASTAQGDQDILDRVMLSILWPDWKEVTREKVLEKMSPMAY